MKPKQADPLEAGGDLGSPREFHLERLQPPQIVGELANPVLKKGAPSLVAGVRSRLRILCAPTALDPRRIYGPDPPTPADIQREADHERLVRAFPMAIEAMEPRKCHAGLNRDGQIGSHYR